MRGGKPRQLHMRPQNGGIILMRKRILVKTVKKVNVWSSNISVRNQDDRTKKKMKRKKE